MRIAVKGATLLATLQKLGVMPSFSRPSVSNDNPYSEALDIIGISVY
jgi:putative transposase